VGRNHDDAVNPKLIALPVAWVKTWTGNAGKSARVFHTTMGSAEDFQNAGLRRMTANAFTGACNWRNRSIPVRASTRR